MYTDTVSVGPPLDVETVHYGSAYAMTDYEAISQNLYFSTSYAYSNKLTFKGLVGYNNSTAEMDPVIFPTLSTEITDRLHHSDFDFSEMHEYSNLDFEFINFSLGVEYMLSDDVTWTLDGEYADLKDKQGYVYGNESGSMFLIRTGFRIGF